MPRHKLPMLMAFGSIALTAACATISTRSRIESELQSLGLSESRAECLAHDLDDNLDRDDLNAVANFLRDLNRSGSPDDALEALLSIDNPRAAAAIARSGVTCALGR